MCSRFSISPSFDADVIPAASSFFFSLLPPALLLLASANTRIRRHIQHHTAFMRPPRYVFVLICALDKLVAACFGVLTLFGISCIQVFIPSFLSQPKSYSIYIWVHRDPKTLVG